MLFPCFGYYVKVKCPESDLVTLLTSVGPGAGSTPSGTVSSSIKQEIGAWGVMITACSGVAGMVR